MYDYLFNKVNDNLQKYYYNIIIKDNKIIKKQDEFYFKFEYFLYIKFYLMYLFFYHFKRHHTFTYSLLLNIHYLVGELCMKNQNHYQLFQENNIQFLDKASHYVFLGLLLMELYFNSTLFIVNKLFIMNGVLFFKLGNIIKKLFEKRKKCIENKTDFQDTFEFLFILPKLEDLNNTMVNIRFFNDINMYFFINVLLILLY